MKPFNKIFSIVYIFFYLISSQLAISASRDQLKLIDLENALNKNNLEKIYSYFAEDEKILLKNKLQELISDFPNPKWKIRKINTKDLNKNTVEVKVTAIKIIDGSEFKLESNFLYSYNFIQGKISNGVIRNHLTTVRNDKNKIDITINIPDKVLTGSKYNIDIIINEPLGEEIYAGSLSTYIENSILEEEIQLEPLVTGGIFKITRAPTKSGIQIWTGIIANPQGLVTFTKTVNIVNEL